MARILTVSGFSEWLGTIPASSAGPRNTVRIDTKLRSRASVRKTYLNQQGSKLVAQDYTGLIKNGVLFIGWIPRSCCLRLFWQLPA